ncbi:polysaccharide export protein [Salinisphaera sp. S4-8]|uniref:polysaccharide biosynthesis/export family protein n=1 Tax=Salinisphaera sp. S4-8 TaxID=633357 RepID=UPI0033405C6E
MTTAAIRFALTLALPIVLSACASGRTPHNVDDARWMPEHTPAEAQQTVCVEHTRPGDYPIGQEIALTELMAMPSVLAPGDRLRIEVIGDQDRLSGVFVIDEDGRINLPGLAPVRAVGRSVADVEALVSRELIQAGFVRALERVASVLLIESGGVFVSVNGAVFHPGSVRVGERASKDRVGQREGEASGDANNVRTLSTAIRAAGGLRPDADLAHVYLTRNGRWARIDLSGVLAGTDSRSVDLAANDHVFIPSRACFQPELMRPTVLTTPGIRVYMSNLSRPAASNASSAISKDATSLPYGTRFLQAPVSANCVGGSAMNAGRSAVLISRNPINGRSVVIQRSVEELVRSAHRDDIDPYLMPGDALACYDSLWMNARDALAFVGEAFGSAAAGLVIHDLMK